MSAPYYRPAWLGAREIAERIGQACERRPDGWGLGKLIVRAVESEALAGHVSIGGLSDEGLLSIVESYLDKIESGEVQP
ncbi:MAG TPA: hypothetical protein VLT47_11170 [Anaeromyxobacteraceae bacterium]|nr:hypothetical protein [Anaeromyxobacteraceae bacterium]